MATHDQIAIRWAKQTAGYARGYAMFFDGRTLFSWGRHFALARLVDTPRGMVCLFNSNGYSASTAKHKSIARRILERFRPDLPVFAVPNPLAASAAEHAANYLAICEEAAGCREKAKRARVYADSWRTDARILDGRAWDYAACFDVPETGMALAA